MASISKRGRYWRAQIVRRGYPPQYRTFDTRAEAEAWSRAMESEMDRGIFVSRVESEKTTLADALGRYEREISVGKAHPEQDYQRIRHWLRQDLAHYFLANLRGADFAKYRDDRLAIGRAANTVRLELALISHLFEIARKERGMEGLMNPLKNIRKPSTAVQIELVGFAHLPKDMRSLTQLARLCRWIEATHGVARVWPAGVPRPAKNGHDPGGHNRDAPTWDGQSGHYGHCHVPENSHWDPG